MATAPSDSLRFSSASFSTKRLKPRAGSTGLTPAAESGALPVVVVTVMATSATAPRTVGIRMLMS